jgi:tetratricopeptide (TPR) repeat protein
MRQLGVLVLSSAVLAGCQNMPDYGWPSNQRTQSTIIKPIVMKPAVPVVVEPQKKIVKAIPATTPQEPVVVAPVPLIMKPVAAPVVKKLADGRDMPAVQGLLASANGSLQQGDFEAAAVSLERAQRLAPQSATVYLQLAQVRLQQNRAVEAEQLARKGLSYAQSSSQQAALWRLVAQAAEQQGKTDTAANANNKAMQLENGR